MKTSSFEAFLNPLFSLLSLLFLHPQAVYGRCEMKNGESLATWTLLGTALPHNGTRVVCQQLSNPRALSAVLHVYGEVLKYSKTKCIA